MGDPEAPEPEPEPDLEFKPTPLEPASGHSLFDFVPVNPLAAYRTIWDARGVRQINERLSEGWELIMVEFCEEVLQRSPTSRLPTATAYQPYAIIGKRAPLVASDRIALADASDRAAEDAAIPLSADAPAGIAEPADPPTGKAPVPMGAKREHHRRPHRTADPNKDGFQGTGGLGGHR